MVIGLKVAVLVQPEVNVHDLILVWVLIISPRLHQFGGIQLKDVFSPLPLHRVDVLNYCFMVGVNQHESEIRAHQVVGVNLVLGKLNERLNTDKHQPEEHNHA